ncbi:MAG: pyridoxal phosphate-dependent aminotransferase [Elusimicrobiaceae bacterium]|nr:pyridoxal phosphate-dependent aminotransferase [Elusimicrobiaceae bacterium]
MVTTLSRLSQIIGDSPTLKINAAARALKAAGEPVIHLGGGEPTYPAPKAAVDAIIAKAQSRKIKYSPSSGTPAMKQAVLAYTEKQYGRRFELTNVLVSAGAKQALFNFLLAAVNAGDEVIFAAPYWVSYPEMVKMAGGVPVIVRPQQGLQVTAEQIIGAVTPKTKAILLNSPCNPSGQIYSETFIKTVVEFAEQHDIFLVMDDIYHQLVFDGCTVPNPCAYMKEGKNLVIINGVSKLYGLTGLRIGWAVSAHKELIAAMGRMQAQSTSCNSDLSETAAAAALTGDQGCITELRKILEDNRNTLLEELAKIPHVQVTKPAGTFYSFADFSHYNASSESLAQYLLEKALVAVVPGKAFGADGYLRISFCADKASIIEGVRRIRWALDETAPNEMKIGDKLITRN